MRNAFRCQGFFIGSRRAGLAACAAVVGAMAAAPTAPAAVVFSDTFETSTLNSASPAAPTANSTDYAVASSKDATGSSIAPGNLKLTMVSTTSGFNEVQARFAASPIVLGAEGDFVQLTATFTTTNINTAGNSTLLMGLYDSNGTTPVPGGGLASSGLNATDTTYASGFAAGWQGYVGRIGVPGNASSQLITRPAQTDTTNESQDLLFNNAGTGAFDNPGGTTIAGSATADGATLANAPYRLELRATRNADGTLTLLQNLYDATTGGNLLYSRTGTTSETSTLTTEFDALAIGYREVVSGPNALDFSSISVESNIPEPGSLALISLGGLLLARRRRH